MCIRDSYNTEPKEQVFANLKKNIKISKENIPAATQLFTPDWIVRYMVENSLGRLWSEGHPDFDKSEWKYYLDEAPQEPQVAQQLAELRKGYAALTPEDIKCIDPCMGSGHILAYLFDVLMQIYRSAGYTDRDAAASIVEHNLYGLDIDDRAAQMAYFVVMMKGCHYDSRFLRRHLDPHVYAIQESNGINRNQLKFFGNGLSDFERNEARLQLEGLLDTLTNAKEYGSILNMENYNWTLLRSCADAAGEDAQLSMDSFGLADTVAQLKQLIDIGEALEQKYDVVVTNPPYMGANGMNPELSLYVKNKFPDSKSDLFACFIEHGLVMTKKAGFSCMVTMQSWMFLSSLERMRTNILRNRNICTLLQMGNGVMGIAFGTAATSIRNWNISGYAGVYTKVVSEDVEGNKPRKFPANNVYTRNQESFDNVPGHSISYWVSDASASAFDEDTLASYATTRLGMSTADNDRFMRNWQEVSVEKIGFCCINSAQAIEQHYKWFPYNKGGSFRKWYGNNDYVVNWENDGSEIRAFKDPKTGRIRSHNYNAEYAFRESLTWSDISSAHNFGIRYSPQGKLFDGRGSSLFTKTEYIHNIHAYLCSCVAAHFLSIINQTMVFNVGDVIQVPFKSEILSNDDVRKLSENCVSLSKSDWDSFENSWNFAEHPFVKWSRQLRDATSIGATMAYFYNGEHPKASCPVELCYLLWQGECNDRFDKLKANEEELNRIFIDIYGLQGELTPEVEDKDVTVRRADLGRDIRSLISYAVGCIFGRYSLDKPGLAYAGGDWNPDQYHTFLPDADNVIPITDEEYFPDDLTGLFVAWVKKVFGAGSLEDNLAFIAKALGTKGTSPRAVIRNYFLNGFYADHVKIYQKRPIYWLYDSGKQNGFKALIYMHRYNADTSGTVRAEYLYKMEQVYESEIARMDDAIAHGASREVAEATKRKEKLVKQLKECKDYDDRLGHIALAQIAIDLDDGVKVNYEKVQTGADGKKQAILAKI